MSADAPLESRSRSSFPVRVYYEDTDAGGIVYHARYLHFAERARTELLRALGVGQASLKAEEGIVFAVRRCSADYRLPARLDDLLELKSRLTALRGASMEIEQEVLRDGILLVRLLVTVAAVNREGRATPIPEALRHKLRSLVHSA